jgi:hypothetical protein
MYISTLIISLILIYLLWVNHKSSPKRIIKSLWNEIHVNSKKIYNANEANNKEIVSTLNKENEEKGFIINNLLNYYYGKNSEEYEYYKYDSEK